MVGPISSTSTTQPRSITTERDGGSERLPAFCNSFKADTLEKLSKASTYGLISTLWMDAANLLKNKCGKGFSETRFDGGKVEITGNNVIVKLFPRGVNSEGFSLNGMPFCFSEAGLQLGVILEFEAAPKNSSGLKLINIKYDFSRPLLAAANIKVGLWDGIGFKLGWKSYVSLARKMSLAPYSQLDTGKRNRPFLTAFDRITIEQRNGGIVIGAELRDQAYLRKGWGTFMFITDEGECSDKKDARPGEFMGDGWAGDRDGGKQLGEGECRDVSFGNRISEALLAWIFKNKNWKVYYKARKGEAGGNKTEAMAALANIILNAGLGELKCNVPFLKTEANKLGKNYLRYLREKK